MILKIKKGISCILTSIVLFTCLSSGLTVIGVDISNIFTYQAATGYYALKGLVDNYQDLLGGITEITLPETYNDLPCALNASTFQNNTYFTKVTVPSSYEALNGFNGCSSIKEIVLLNEEQVSFKLSCLKNCTALETLKIYASSLASNPTLATFTNVPTTAVAYVKNDTVKEQLVNWPGSIIVDPSLGGGDTVNYTSLDTAIADGEAVDTTKYTEDSVKALTDAIAAAKAVKENSNATQDDVDNAAKAITDAIAGLKSKLDYTSHDVFVFTYTVRDTYSAVFADNYVDVLTSLGTTELEIPYTYDDGVNGEKMIESVSISSVKDDYITKVILDEGYSTVSWARAFRYFTSLETVEFKYKGNDFSIGSIFRDNTSIKEVYIHASTMNVSGSEFRGLSSDAKVYVDNEAVKTAIVNGTASGSYPVSADQIIVLGGGDTVNYTSLDTAIADGEAVDTTKYTEDSVKVLTDAIAAAKAVKENAAATQDDVDAAAKAITDAIAGLKSKLDYTALDKAIADGEAVDTTKYTADSVMTLTEAIAAAKAVKENADATQDDVNVAAKAIEDAVSALEIVWPITYDISAKHDGSVKAAVYIDGSLLISGSGATADYTGGGTNITPLANHEITSVKVEEGITDLGDWLFYDCTAITSITFPSTLKSIGARCFSHTGFTSIEIPDSVTSVGSYAFGGCSSLVTVKLPSGLTTLNEGTFYYCKSLTSVNIPDGVTSIGSGVFSSCTGLTSIDLPSGLTSIESFAFNGCGLTGDVVVPSGVVALKSQVFMNCTSSDLKIHLLGVIESYHNIGYASNPFEGVTGTIYVYNQASYDLLKKYVPATATLVFSNAYTDLETAINEADSKKEADYTSDSWEAFLTALANAKAVLASGSSDFTAAKTDLTKAIEALVFADTSEIKESLAELVEKIELLLTLKDESNYTSESWTTLSKALEAAKTEETLTVSGYTALYNDLSNAYSGLTAVSTSDSEYLGTIYGGYEKTYNHETDSYKVVTSDDVDMNRVVGTTYVNVTCTPNDELKSQLPYGKLHIWNFLDGDQSYTKLNGSADNVFTYNLSIPSADSAFSLTAGTGWTSDKEVFYVKSVGFYNSDDELLYIYSVDAAGSEERSALKSAIEAAEKFDKNYYTEESVALLELMIEEANEMLNNVSATKDDCSVRVSELDAAVKALVANVVTGTVTGTIKVSDSNAETEMTVTAVAADGIKTTVTATSMGTYTLENLPVGDYTLTISGGKYAERSYKITVAEGDNAHDVNLNPLGDINGDGKITTADVGMANSHAKGVKTLTDYDFVCANVSDDESVTTADVGMVNSHAKGVKPLW